MNYLNNEICGNCRYFQDRVGSIYMGKQPPRNGSCTFLSAGLKVRGSVTENDTCNDFERGEFSYEDYSEREKIK